MSWTEFAGEGVDEGSVCGFIDCYGNYRDPETVK